MIDEKAFLFLAVVSEVPAGKVASYSQIARLSGYPQNARLVGKVLSNAEYWGNYPCHRIIHADGSLVSGWDEQRALLEAENVQFLGNGKVDLKNHKWDE